MHHVPKTILCQYLELGSTDSNNHDDDKRKSSNTRKTSDENEQTADDLNRTNKWTEDIRRRKTNFDKSPGTKLSWKKKLLYSLREEYKPHHKAYQQHA